MASVRRIIVGVCAAWLALIAAPAMAQTGPRVSADAPLRIDGINVEEVAQLAAGTQLSFSLFGTPGAVASLQIEGARHGLLLREAERGVYEGTYTIDTQDRIAADGPVVGTLRRGAEVAQSVLDEPLVLGALAPDADSARARSAATPRPVPADVPSSSRRWAATPVPRRAAACTDCAVVESVRVVETSDREGIAGAIGGGLLGAILGNQIGHGDLRGFARIVGAVGGALTGRAIERAGSRRVRYDVVLRLPDGGAQIHSYDAPPPVRVGDRVRVPPVTYARAPRFDSPD